MANDSVRKCQFTSCLPRCMECLPPCEAEKGSAITSSRAKRIALSTFTWRGAWQTLTRSPSLVEESFSAANGEEAREDWLLDLSKGAAAGTMVNGTPRENTARQHHNAAAFVGRELCRNVGQQRGILSGRQTGRSCAV